VNHRDLKNPFYTYWRHWLGQTATWTRYAIDCYQLQELRRVVTQAYDLCPAYRVKFEQAGVSPETLLTIQDFRRFPFLYKTALRDNLDGHSIRVPGRYYRATGGSTGIPVKMYHTPRAFGRELASKAHQYHRAGWKEGDPELVFRGMVVNDPSGMEYVEDMNTLRCSSYHMSEADMERYYRAALSFRPKWLRCYPSAGYIFARFMQDRGYRLNSVMGVLCASEPVYDFQRHLFLQVFSGARVFSHYGHYEMAALAGFCEAGGHRYHVLPFYGYVELLDEADNPVVEKGKVGEIVATSFIMDATPIIRYRTQDYAVYDGPGCPLCSRPYQIWSNVDGRSQDYIVTARGRILTGTMLNDHDLTYDDLYQFQFYQDTPGVVEFRYIPRPATLRGVRLESYLREQLMRKLGDDTQLVLKEVEALPKSKRGKHRFIVQARKGDQSCQ